MGIVYIKSDFEDDDIPEYFKIYDELIEIYIKIISNTNLAFTVNEILEGAIAQMEREQVQLGMFESRILEVVEKMTSAVGNISDVIKDKKKLGGFLKTIKKELSEIGNMISGIKDGDNARVKSIMKSVVDKEV
jgi:hypothetical protein